MIDLINDIIERTQEVMERTYREFPAVDTGQAMPFAVVAHAGHGPLMNDDRGKEVLAQLAYSVRVYANDLEQVDSFSDELTNIYNQMGINIVAYSTAYSDVMECHYSTMTLSVKADIRGGTFR